MEVYVKLKKFLSEKRLLLKIKNFEMILEKTENTETQNTDESRVHIKYINILENNDKKKELTVERTDNGDKFKFVFPVDHAGDEKSVEWAVADIKVSCYNQKNISIFR